MRSVIGCAAFLMVAGCQTPTPPFPAADSGPITPAELAHSFDSGVSSRLIIFTRADRDCTLAAAATLAEEAGEPEPGNAENLPQIYVEGSRGLQKIDNQISNRELLAARLVGEAARSCQVEDGN